MNLPGPFELLLIFLVALLVFGAKRLPEIGRSIGTTIRDLRRMHNVPWDENEEEKKPEKPSPKN